jgi:hypothetical protein
MLYGRRQGAHDQNDQNNVQDWTHFGLGLGRFVTPRRNCANIVEELPNATNPMTAANLRCANSSI